MNISRAEMIGCGVRFPGISPDARTRITRLARQITQEERRIGDITVFGKRVRRGLGEGAAIVIGDTAEIALMRDTERHHLDYRLGWLARSGDLVVVGGPACTAFESYQRRILDEPGIGYLHVRTHWQGRRHAVARLCLHDEAVYDSLLRYVRESGDTTLIAHITTGTIWALAARLAAATGATIRVAGPPPLLSRRVNHKLWFGSVAARLLGADMIPTKRSAYSASALTRHVAELAGRYRKLAVKVPDSAGSAGNVVFECAPLRHLRPAALHARLRHAMTALGWPPPFPMAVEVWDADVLSSPSVQAWIPAGGTLPVIEGIYQQVLEGEAQAFAGAVEAELPAALDETLSCGAMQLALLFQELGYFGRCSFDTIVYRDARGRAGLHWIECNGRWGGVSVPMSLVNRLAPGRERPPHVIVQRKDLEFRARPFPALEVEFADQRVARDLSSGTLFLSPDLISDGAGCHFMCFGQSQQAALDLSHDIVRRLLTADG